MNILSDAEYNRQRLDPRQGDPFYLPLSDLLMAIKQIIPPYTERVLDYGCGGSPYRPLFGEAIYHRADLAGTPSVDFEYGHDSRLPVNSSEYDCVLSSQVLEHVPSPSVYLSEAHRVLKPGGKLILSTHGLFEDHACPADYWRWTVYGLKELVEQAGFTTDSILKLTTGPRAAVFFTEQTWNRSAYASADRYSRAMLVGLWALQRVAARRRHKACDSCFAAHRVVHGNDAGHNSYVIIALSAHR